MTMDWIEWVTGPLADKKRYRQYKERIRALPPNYRAAVEAIDRYLMYFGGVTKGDVLVSMLEALIDLFEDSAAHGVAIREIVGPDPVAFVETFLANYSDGQWINKERERMIDAIDRAAAEGAVRGSVK